MMVLIRIGWRNLWRHRRRTLITSGAMAVGAALCMASIALNDGMYAQLFDIMVVQQMGHVQVHHPDQPSTKRLHDTLPDGLALAAQIEAQEGTVGAAPRANAFVLLGGSTSSVGALLVGVSPPHEGRAGRPADWIVEGEPLSDEPAGQMTIGRDLAKELEVEIGDSLVVVTQAADGSLGNEDFDVVGIHQTGQMQLDRMGAFVHLSEFQEMLVLGKRVHTITVLTDDLETIPQYTASLRALLASDTVTVNSWFESSPPTAQLLSSRDFGTFITLGIVFGAAAFGVLNTMMMSVFERTRELGVLLALGMRPARMVSLILIESVCLASLALFLGIVLGGLLDWYLVVVGLDFSSSGEGFSMSGVTFEPIIHGEVRLAGIVYVAVALYVVGVGASLWPALRAARLVPVRAIRMAE